MVWILTWCAASVPVSVALGRLMSGSDITAPPARQLEPPSPLRRRSAA